MIMNDSVTKVCNELITEFVAFHCAQTLHNLIGIHSVHRLPLTYTCHYSSYLIISGSLFPSGMAEVFAVAWIAYFSLVLIVSKLSLHKARFASISNHHVICMSHIMPDISYIFQSLDNMRIQENLPDREKERGLPHGPKSCCVPVNFRYSIPNFSLAFGIKGVVNSFSLIQACLFFIFGFSY